jgi:hypothetical protein
MHSLIVLPSGQQQQVREVCRGYWLPVSAATPGVSLTSKTYSVVHEVSPWYQECDKRLSELVQRYSIAG